MATEKEVFDFYQDTFKRIYADLVAVIGNKPTEIIFEIEACFSHLGVAKTSSIPQVQQDNIDKALGHLQRASLDSAKLLWLNLRSNADQIVKNKSVMKFVSNCSEGELYKHYNNAESLAIKARRNEVASTGISPSSSIVEWYDAALALKSFLDNIDYDKLSSFNRFKVIYNIREYVIGFCMGLFVNWISPKLF